MLVSWPYEPYPVIWTPCKYVRPHLEALDWIIKDDGFGKLRANHPSMDEQVVTFLKEDLH